MYVSNFYIITFFNINRSSIVDMDASLTTINNNGNAPPPNATNNGNASPTNNNNNGNIGTPPSANATNPHHVPPSKHARKMPKRKKKFGHSARKGGNKKNSKSYPVWRDANQHTTQPSLSASITPTPRKRKPTKSDLAMEARYATRERNKLRKSNASLKVDLETANAGRIEDIQVMGYTMQQEEARHQQDIQVMSYTMQQKEARHQQEITKINDKCKKDIQVMGYTMQQEEERHQDEIGTMKSKLLVKTQECQDLAALAQQHRKEENSTKWQCAETLARMKETSQEEKGEWRTYAESTVRAERRFQQHKAARKDEKHKKDMTQQEQYYSGVIAVKELENKQLLEELIAQSTNHKSAIKTLEVTHQDQLRNLKANHREALRNIRRRHEEAIDAHKLKINTLQKESVKLLNMMHEIMTNVDDHRKQAKQATKKVTCLSARAASRMKVMAEY